MISNTLKLCKFEAKPRDLYKMLKRVDAEIHKVFADQPDPQKQQEMLESNKIRRFLDVIATVFKNNNPDHQDTDEMEAISCELLDKIHVDDLVLPLPEKTLSPVSYRSSLV